MRRADSPGKIAVAQPEPEAPLILARQPILTNEGDVFGYELLYRGKTTDAVEGETTWSARVVCDALSNWGTQRLVGDARMFVNFGQDLLETNLPLIFRNGRGVVEVLETVEPTAAVLATLVKLRQFGVEIAADDFEFSHNTAAFLPYVDYVKIDIQASANQLDSLVTRLQPFKRRLIAEKVETHEEAVRCHKLGIDLFQGYYFARPMAMHSNTTDPSHMAVISLVGYLQDPDLDASDLANTIGSDLGLTHRILKLANMAAYRRQRPINSITDAVVLLGQELIRRWATLMLLTRIGERKPAALFSLALIRGRMCQALGANNCSLDPQELYTVGMLSVLDALLDRPMTDLVDELPLTLRLREALCGTRLSALGAVLRHTLEYEVGDWASLGALTRAEEASVSNAYAEATYFAQVTLGK